MSRHRTATCIALATVLAACAADAGGSSVSAVQFQDVVVPSGMRLQDSAHESYSQDLAGSRRGHFEYVGQTDMAAAADYVRGRMPQHGWTKVQDEADGDGGLRLRFEREVYRAAYSLRRSEGVTIMVVDYTTDHQRR